jgi:hypothetical protein
MLVPFTEGLLVVHNYAVSDGSGCHSWKVSFFADPTLVVRDLLDSPAASKIISLHMDHDTVQVYIKDEDRQWREGYQSRESWLGTYAEKQRRRLKVLKPVSKLDTSRESSLQLNLLYALISLRVERQTGT